MFENVSGKCAGKIFWFSILFLYCALHLCIYLFYEIFYLKELLIISKMHVIVLFVRKESQ